MLLSKSDHLIDYRAQQSSGAEVEAGSSVSLESVSAIIAKMFSLDITKMEATTPLTQYGLDSLLAVELSATLKKKFNLKLTQMELLGGLTVEKIVARAQ